MMIIVIIIVNHSQVVALLLGFILEVMRAFKKYTLFN